eukprot:TRINITY_DN51911_c0_g1_i1.p1 TRINITY_DN51911_c0_g1~~TRINITY_DN51911_c0_g1_i1.p1  ORF type:complete len:345 (+),score=95.34 TRINITY_DN51911_c0_g1_i1:117-1037(+)
MCIRDRAREKEIPRKRTETVKVPGGKPTEVKQGDNKAVEMLRWRMCNFMVRIMDMATHRIAHEELFRVQDCLTAWSTGWRSSYQDKHKKAVISRCLNTQLLGSQLQVLGSVYTWIGQSAVGAVEKEMEAVREQLRATQFKMALKTFGTMMHAWKMAGLRQVVTGWHAVWREEMGQRDANFDKEVAVEQAMKPVQDMVDTANKEVKEIKSNINGAGMLLLLRVMAEWMDLGKRGCVRRWVKAIIRHRMTRAHQAHGFGVLHILVVKAWRMTQTALCISEWRERRNMENVAIDLCICLLYTSPSPRDS